MADAAVVAAVVAAVAVEWADKTHLVDAVDEVGLVVEQRMGNLCCYSAYKHWVVSYSSKDVTASCCLQN